jgi:ABC-type nitrate/sulfonate/bicarbonate transport system substrate-binding protein
MARTRRSFDGRLGVLLALVFVAFSFPASAAAQLGGRPEKSNVTISYIQASGAFTSLWVAQEAGLFKKHGLDASLKQLNSQVSAQALIAGEIDIISIGPDLVNARLQGAPLKYIGGTLQRFVFQLWGAQRDQLPRRAQGQDGCRDDAPHFDRNRHTRGAQENRRPIG